MDVQRLPNRNIELLKAALTPAWRPDMGKRLRTARQKMLKNQSEFAAMLSGAGGRVSQQQVAAVEVGRLEYLAITWAQLEDVLGPHTSFVLTARDWARYDERLIARKYQEFTQKTRRKNANPARLSRYFTAKERSKWER